MRTIILSTIALITLAVLSSCSSSSREIVVAEFDHQKVSYDQYEKAYEKSAANTSNIHMTDSVKNKDKFIDLYVDYLLKLQDAKDKGFENDQAVKNELNDYRKKIGTTYILEKELVEPALKDLYEKRKYEEEVAHIFFSKDSIPIEQSYKIAELVIDSIKHGASFTKMVHKYSDDKFSKEKDGVIGFLTAGVTRVPSIEDAAFDTPVDSIYPKPVITPYGTHVIKVIKKVDRKPDFDSRHILIKFADDSGKVDTAAALAKIKDIRQQIVAGANFQEMAKKYSDDKNSGKNGGDLGFVSSHRLVPEYEEAVYKLKPGEISPIVKTRFGFHIIQLVEFKKEQTFDEQKGELKKLYENTRYNNDRKQFLEKVAEKIPNGVNQNTLNLILKNNDSVWVNQKYFTSKLHDIVKDSTLFYVSDMKFNLDSVIANVLNDRSYMSRPIDSMLVMRAVNKIKDDELLNAYAGIYQKNDSTFAALMEDYKNGIYLFKLLEDEVWTKVNVDSVMIFNYYQETKNNYFKNETVGYSTIYTAQDSIINKCYDLLNSGENFDSVRVKYSLDKYSKQDPSDIKMVEVSSNSFAEAAAKLANIGDYSAPFTYEKRWVIVKLLKKDPKRLKTFEEAKPEIASILQERESKRLENEYLQKLKGKYNPVIYYDRLKEASAKN